jgi:transcriptional regulator with XRE-family HTH domain
MNAIRMPLPVIRSLRKLGRDIRDARRRRRIPAAILAERASMSRTTLHKIEKGDAGVLLGNFATVLFALGMIDGLADVADVRNDTLGLQLEEEQLPKRVHIAGRRKSTKPKNGG